ncbi:MAG: hypothetical protein ABJG47_18535 [Ekhidna sp.]
MITLVLASCQNSDNEQSNTNEHKYLTVFRKGNQTDTLTKKLARLTFIDSVYNLTYTEELDSQSYELPIAGVTQTTAELGFKLIDKKSIYYEGDEPTNYLVYKFLFDDPNADDEEMLVFFSPEFGILIEKAAWWGNYGKLVDTGNPSDKDELFFLTEMIMFDSDFFHNWTNAAANKH